MDKRKFLKSLGLLSAASITAANGMDKWINDFAHVTAEELAQEETFWMGIRGNYKLKPDYINLENGYYCILPQETLEIYINHIREVNYQGSYYMRTVQFENKKLAAGKLAAVAGCSPEELIIPETQQNHSTW